MEKLTSSIYSFEQMRQNNFLYVDKTESLWTLINSAPAMYFLSRPRRFGKSLTLSTLKAIFHETINEYYIKFPNREVKESFNKCLLKNYTGIQEKDSVRLIQDLIQSIGSGNVDCFVNILKEIFAGIPYEIHIKHEHYYQTIIYVIFDMPRFYIHAEHQTNNGRIDLMLSAGEWIYVVELKLNQSANKAIKQIENKEYALQFRHHGKRIMAIGINFDSQNGQITDWRKEEISAKK